MLPKQRTRGAVKAAQSLVTGQQGFECLLRFRVCALVVRANRIVIRGQSAQFFVRSSLLLRLPEVPAGLKRLLVLRQQGFAHAQMQQRGLRERQMRGVQLPLPFRHLRRSNRPLQSPHVIQQGQIRRSLGGKAVAGRPRFLDLVVINGVPRGIICRFGQDRRVVLGQRRLLRLVRQRV